VLLHLKIQKICSSEQSFKEECQNYPLSGIIDDCSNRLVKVKVSVMTNESKSSVPLVEVIDALREDLKIAQANSDPDNPLIINEIEIELQVVVTKEAQGEAKAKIEVLNMGGWLGLGKMGGKVTAKGAWLKASTQKLTLKLSAGHKDPDTGKLSKARVSDRTSFE
jgi:hypothetical protein